MPRHIFSSDLLKLNRSLLYVQVYKGEGNHHSFEGLLYGQTAKRYLASLADELGYRLEPKYPACERPEGKESE